MATPSKSERKDVYEMISEQILQSLEAGTIPWKKPWASRGGQRNVRGTPYRGVNQFILQCVGMNRGYTDPLWLTFNQARAAGGSVRKGEKGTPVVFWKMLKREEQKPDGSKEDKSFMMLRHYTVFNVGQCDNVAVVRPSEDTTRFPAEPLAACEAIVAGMPKAPVIKIGGDRACYSPATDEVHMPARTSFPKVDEFYSTMFHELAHSTGAKTRLARKGIVDFSGFGSHQYGQEELVAEFTAAFLCGMTGIAPATVENSAAYIDHWKKAVRLDNKLVVMAAAQAQKAADFVLGVKHGEKDDEEDDKAAD